MSGKKRWMIGLGGVFTLLGGYTIYKFSQPPNNRPKDYQRQDKNRQLVACLGDSNTQGTMAYNFVNELATSMGKKDMTLLMQG